MANTITLKNEKGGAMLYSYQTLIAVKNEGEPLKLTDKWDYSKTTLKHLYAFIEKNAPDVHNIIKAAANKSAAIRVLLDRGTILCLK